MNYGVINYNLRMSENKKILNHSMDYLETEMMNELISNISMMLFVLGCENLGITSFKSIMLLTPVITQLKFVPLADFTDSSCVIFFNGYSELGYVCCKAWSSQKNESAGKSCFDSVFRFTPIILVNVLAEQYNKLFREMGAS